jgi:3-deoxy-D-manno-octulosonic acid kinase
LPWAVIVERVLAGVDLSPAAGAVGRGAVAEISGGCCGLSFDLIARQYRRGGLLRRLRRDVFRSPSRFLNELRIHARVRELGVPAPEPLGVIAVVSPGRSGWQGFLVTRRLVGVTGLAEWLCQTLPPERLSLAQELGRGLRCLHRAGIFYADLQIHNVLVAAGRPFFIDFDKSRLFPTPLSESQRRANLYRFARSLEKFRCRGGCFGHLEPVAFLQAYAPEPAAYRRLFAALARGLLWRRLFYRVGWWLNRS